MPAGGNATLVNVQTCVRTNVLQEATLAIYEDDRLAWCATICLCGMFKYERLSLQQFHACSCARQTTENHVLQQICTA